MKRKFELHYLIEEWHGRFYVMEYDTNRMTKAILSIHQERQEAEENLELAKRGQHSTQK